MERHGSVDPAKPFEIRALRAEDIPSVAALWLRVFRNSTHEPTESLLNNFQTVFLQNPWRSDDLPSLVCVTSEGAVGGFLGVIPRRMVFRGKPVRVAVATQLMVDPRKALGFAAIALVRRFLSGPQDLSYSDGAKDHAAKLWQLQGGGPALLLSMEWTRVFRPARHLASILSQKKGLRPLAWLSRPACWLIDSMMTRLPFGPYRTRQMTGDIEEATAESILKCWAGLPAKPALHPDYDPASFHWLLEMASSCKLHGDLRSALVRGVDGRPRGWFIYYLRPGGVSRLLQWAAADQDADFVLDHLFADASRNGSAAITGGAVPRHLRNLDDHHCRFRCRSLGVAVHTRNDALAAAIHRGDVFLSRLDGEWWLRLSNDRLE
jgi:hypothetical protein